MVEFSPELLSSYFGATPEAIALITSDPRPWQRGLTKAYDPALPVHEGVLEVEGDHLIFTSSFRSMRFILRPRAHQFYLDENEQDQPPFAGHHTRRGSKRRAK